MRKAAAVFIALLLLAAGLYLVVRKPSFKGRPLNLLLITIDTLRADYLSCYASSPVRTPHIDELAANSVVFTKAFANTTLTLPSHTNILLGVTPLYHGVHENSGFRVGDDQLTLAEFLKGKGYETAAIVGAFPLDSRFGLNQGFDLYDDEYGSGVRNSFTYVERRAEEVINRAIAWLQQRSGKKPWFLWIHLFDPHKPYSPPPAFADRFRDNPYAGEVAYVDQQLGRLFEFLKRRGIEKDLLLILTSDHGEGLGEHGEQTHGYFAYNSTLHVPLIFYSPSLFKPAKVDFKVSHIDIFPTVCDVFGFKPPAHLQGHSLLPALLGRKLKKEPIYFESLSAYLNRGWAPLRGFIEGSYKFIDLPVKELYNIDSDFAEKKNLAAKANTAPYEKKLSKLIKKLSKSAAVQQRKIEDRRTMEIFRSLGYVAGFSPPSKRKFTPADDLKRLLPLHQKYLRSIELFTEGKVQEAEALLEEVIRARKDFIQAYITLANFYRMTGDVNRGIELLKRATKVAPRSFELLSTLGIALVEAGRAEEAAGVLEKAVKVIDYDPEAWNYLGLAYSALGRFDDAMKAYRKATELDPNYAVVYSNMGTLMLTMKIPEDAIPYFEKALRFDPNLASAYNGLAAAYRMMGDIERAIRLWKKAVEVDPNYPLALYNLGFALAKVGRKKEAEKYLTKYIKILGHEIPPGERRMIERIIGKK